MSLSLFYIFLVCLIDTLAIGGVVTCMVFAALYGSGVGLVCCLVGCGIGSISGYGLWFSGPFYVLLLFGGIGIL